MQHRVEGITFAEGIFTNLTEDHLDYHGTMERYCGAKAKLFHASRGGGVQCRRPLDRAYAPGRDLPGDALRSPKPCRPVGGGNHTCRSGA